MICKNCYAQVSKNNKICPKCGKPLRHPKFALFLTLGIVLAAVIVATAIIIGLFGKKPEGDCGENLKWWIDKSSSTLYIEGEGEMEDYSFDNSAPWESQKFKNVVLKDGVTNIGERAFFNCKSLESITIPDSVTSIEDFAFAACGSLADIDIPDSVTSIGESAFFDCDSLANINIPDSVKSLGHHAFNMCSSLGTIRFEGTEEHWNELKAGKSFGISDSVTVIYGK